MGFGFGVKSTEFRVCVISQGLLGVDFNSAPSTVYD